MPGQIRTNCSRPFEGLTYLAYKIRTKIHIIQFSLFSGEYLHVAGK